MYGNAYDRMNVREHLSVFKLGGFYSNREHFVTVRFKKCCTNKSNLISGVFTTVCVCVWGGGCCVVYHNSGI